MLLDCSEKLINDDISGLLNDALKTASTKEIVGLHMGLMATKEIKPSTSTPSLK